MYTSPESRDRDSEQSDVGVRQLLSELRQCDKKDKQGELVRTLLSRAESLKGQLRDQEHDATDTAPKYGRVMDQTAINLPANNSRAEKMYELQREALQELTSHFYKRPTAGVAREIFMLYHHGAGAGKQAHKSHLDYFNEKSEDTSFAREYLHSERIAGGWLNTALVRYFDDNGVDIDRDKFVEKIIGEYEHSQKDSLIMDVANYYRRFAYYKKMLSVSYDVMYVRQAMLGYKHFEENNSVTKSGLQELKSEFNLD